MGGDEGVTVVTPGFKLQGTLVTVVTRLDSQENLVPATVGLSAMHEGLCLLTEAWHGCVNSLSSGNNKFKNARRQ